MTSTLSVLLLGLPAGLLIFNIASGLAGRLFGYPVTTFSIGFGPEVLRFDAAGTRYVVRLVPAGGAVSFGARPDGGAFEAASPIARIVAAFAGPAATAGVAAIVAGPQMLSEVSQTFTQIAGLFAAPFADMGVADAVSAALAARGLPGAFGLVLAKLAAFNMLPFAFTSGGIVIAELIRLATGRPIGEGALQVWLKLSLAVCLALAVLLVLGLVREGS